MSEMIEVRLHVRPQRMGDLAIALAPLAYVTITGFDVIGKDANKPKMAEDIITNGKPPKPRPGKTKVSPGVNKAVVLKFMKDHKTARGLDITRGTGLKMHTVYQNLARLRDEGMLNHSSQTSEWSYKE